MNHVTYISAGAGSGKTFTLTSILADLIVKEKATPDQFILTTFTEAAASEFREKAKAKIYEHTEYAKYAEAAEKLDQSMIGTVDSIANSFVQKYWFLLGVSPNQKIIDDEQKKFFISQVFSKIATPQDILFLDDFCEQFNIANDINSKNFGLNYDFWKEYVLEIFEKIQSYNIADVNICREKSLAFATSITGEGNLNYSKEDVLKLLNEIQCLASDTLVSKVKDLKIVFSNEQKISDVVKIIKILDEEINQKTATGRDKKLKTNLFKKDGNEALFNSVYDSLGRVYSSKKVRDLVLKYINLIFGYVEKAREEFKKFKEEHHLIDFVDMETRFLELLDKDEVQQDICNTYKYVFVDEFQDSSPLQVKIFDKLSEIVGRDECDDFVVTIGTGKDTNEFHIHNSIWVGDFKQAIYGFRGADTDLTKAVADIIAQKQISLPKQFKIHTLKKSFRSLENIVDFTNELFVPAFEGILKKEEVELIAHRPQDNAVKSLKCWKVDGKKEEERLKNLALQIAKRLKNGEKPSDYAVLARRGAPLNKLSDALKTLNVPVCRTLEFDEKRDELALISALMNLVTNDFDNYSRAVVAFLTQKGFDAGRIIDAKLEFDKSYQDNKNCPKYLSDNSILAKFAERRDFYRMQTIHNLVESLIVDLDLYSVGRGWENAVGTDECFAALIEASYDYEERCSQIGISPTISGYVDYCKDNAKSAGSKDGVVLSTFHHSKGLEWKKVILLDLDEDVFDENKRIKYGVLGVHNYHDVAPSESNLYPPMIINLMPNLFAGNTNVAEDMAEKIKNSGFFKSTCQSFISETIRLLYVAITRAKDELILTLDEENPLQVFSCLKCHIQTGADYENGKEVSLFSFNNQDTNERLKFLFENDKLSEGDSYQVEKPEKLVFKKNEKIETANRDQQPSKVKPSRKVTANIVFDSGSRIKANPDEMDKFGTCIHNIFCVLEKSPTVEMVEKIIKNHQMETALPQPEDVLKAWQNLEKFLTEKYGAKVATYHELPFRHMLDGQIFNGEMDLVWETDKGVVLVDFKSYPGNNNDVVAVDNDHYAGKYAGQFECYDCALKAAGKNVLARLVYYHVLGVVVELKFDKE
ncbi:UvrD/REP helicase [Fibrobacter succinogenes subsp. succinogenes S85]|uniref:DNA 3'-5' helicase n=2 Tax=Fibrobacter succinogenes (strain ATCC 19169 / S85) TaxID=59374 RepID=A0ABN3YUR8_FIBSS|nr:UvrD-helicase domain-containing protein [Fibrobacter succinogenes]ACX75376.1 UvrD/REP helicase [Fibrobacter succinogenes subsp. succinogenes S85]